MPDSLPALLETLRDVERRGGPTPDQYATLVTIFDAISRLRGAEAQEALIAEFLASVPSFATPDTMQGFVQLRPHGYAGDFEIIDRIYREHHAEDHHAWDRFFHAGDAAKAVRARKDYCIELFGKHAARKTGASILNVASGPCRDLLEFKSSDRPGVAETRVHCIDMDANAIAFAQTLLSRYLSTVTFEQRNILRARLTPGYDLVWSAGLFDYFDDRVFVKLLQRLHAAVAPGGELVVGNFTPGLNAKSYMEFGDWHLNYRDEPTLRRLAQEAGFEPGVISVGREPNGVNLFLHVARL